MVIFHSYVSLPEGTWESHDMIPVAIHLSLDVWSTKTPRLTDLQPYLTWKKKTLPTSVPYQTNPWQKWNFWSTGACTPCYCTTLHLAAVGRHDDGQLGSFDLCQRCWISISIIPAIPMVKTHPSGYLIVSINQINPWLSIFNFKSMVVIVGHRFPTISMPVARCSLPTQPLTQPRYLLITPHSLRSAANMFSLATFSITWVLGGIPKCLSQQTWSCRVPAGFALCAPYCGDCEVVFFALC